MQPDAGVGLRCGRRRRVPFRILIREHQDGIADPDLGVHYLSLRPKAEAHQFSAEGTMVKVGGRLGVAHDNMRGKCVKTFGNRRYCTAHETLLVALDVQLQGPKLSKKFPPQQSSHLSAHRAVEPAGFVPAKASSAFVALRGAAGEDRSCAFDEASDCKGPDVRLPYGA